MKLKTLMLAMVAATVSAAGAMTMSELQGAIDSAEPGDTVYVTSDLEYDAPLDIGGKRLTLASGEGGPFTITRAASYAAGQFLDFTSGGSDLTISNLTVSGNKAAGKCSGRFIYVKDGKLTLAIGATLADYYCTAAGTIKLEGPTTGQDFLVMEDGAVIRGLENDSYAFGVQVSGQGTFKMTGGLITGCVGHDRGEANGGVIYIYGGTFAPIGGTVAGNVSENSVAGVNAYSGRFDFSGSFTATNNVGGAANDVCRSGSCSLRIMADYTGWMTIKFPGVTPEANDKAPTFIYTSKQYGYRKGCLNITSEDDPTLGLDFESLYDMWYGYWRKIVARIDGTCNTMDFGTALEKSISGDTIVLLSDTTFTESRSLSTKNLTIRSGNGIHVFRRCATDAAFLNVDHATLRLEDVIIDGQRDLYPGSRHFADMPGLMTAGEDGRIELGSGCIICNASGYTMGAALALRKAGSRIVMEEGSVISNCTVTGTGYGTLVVVGNGTTCDPPPCFEMRGGLITGNDTGPNASTKLPGYSGIIYLYAGVMDMSGGMITGNTSQYGCSSVYCYSGDLKVTGAARISGNTGTTPGVYCSNTSRVRPYGDLRGLVDISSPSQTKGGYPLIQGATGYTGAWCFQAASAAEELVGYNDGGYVYWDSPIGSIGGVKVAREADLAYLVPTTLDLSAGSADRARLPIIFTGAAVACGGAVMLSYDPVALRKSGDRSIALLVPGVDETLTGNWSFTLPSDTKGSWDVTAAADGARTLAYYPPGLSLTVK